MTAKKPGAKMGRPPKKHGRSVYRSCKVSKQVDAYIAEVGSGVIEDSIRRSRAFKEWVQANGG